MPRFVTDSRPISAQHPITEFYREEFVKHHRCLQQQRPYYSESAITDVEAALTESSASSISSPRRQRRPTRQLPPQEIRRRDRAFSLVRSQTHPLTRSLPQLRQDLLDIVRAGIRACAAGALVDARARPTGAATLQPMPAPGAIAPCIAAREGRAGDGHGGGAGACGRESEPVSSSAPRTADVPAPFESIVGGHPLPTSDSEARAARRWRSPHRSPRTRLFWCSCPAARRR